MSTEEAKASKPTPADQGVPADYLREDGKAFKTGMDARLKSDLVASVVGDITVAEPGKSLHVFTEKEAMKILEARGWTGFLDRKREIKAAETAKKEAAAKERAEKAEAAATEKADKAAKAAAAKSAAKPGESAAAKASGSAAPDPKPGKK